MPTMNRTEFVVRAVRYYVSVGCEHPIFIGDGSLQSSEELILQEAKGKIEIYYFNWTNVSIRKTIIKLAEKASDIYHFKYCAFQGDDDFLVADSLSKCAEFLEHNPLYTSAQGHAFTFKLNQEGPYGDVEELGVYWNKKELNGETSLERLNEISNDYWVPIFSVHRTKDFIKDMSIGIDTISHDEFLGEYANSLTLALRGKSKFIECLYLARNVHSGIDHPTIFQWIMRIDLHSSYKELVAIISNELSKNDNLDSIKSNNSAEYAIQKLLEKNAGMRYPSTLEFIKSKYSFYISKRGVIYFLSRLYIKLKNLSFLPVKDFSRRALRSRKSKYYKDISLILNACKKNNL